MLAHQTDQEKGLYTMSIPIIAIPKIEVKKMNNDKDRFFIALALSLLVAAALAVIYLTKIEDEPLPELTHSHIEVKEIIFEDVAEIVAESEPTVHLTDDDILAMVCMAEAEGEELLGKVAVVTTILNRCDYYDLTVETVVNAKNQYASYIDEVPNEECWRAVEIAKANRDLFPADMMFFRNSHYHDFGQPYMEIGNHYFSRIGD